MRIAVEVTKLEYLREIDVHPFFHNARRAEIPCPELFHIRNLTTADELHNEHTGSRVFTICLRHIEIRTMTIRIAEALDIARFVEIVELFGDGTFENANNFLCVQDTLLLQ